VVVRSIELVLGGPIAHYRVSSVHRTDILVHWQFAEKIVDDGPILGGGDWIQGVGPSEGQRDQGLWPWKDADGIC
jgi:hypothetical protein